MSNRKNILAAVAVVLRRMDEVNKAMNQPGKDFDSLQAEWHSLEREYQGLRERLAVAQEGK
jgi:hypothetical protein